MRELFFEPAAWEKLKAVCEKGYPKEVCGLLFGKEGTQTVTRIETLSNILDTDAERLKETLKGSEFELSKDRIGRKGAFEFIIDPQEHQSKVLSNARNGLDQIGLFHSHPDHPAEPSATDASQPMLAGWSNIIVAVHGGKVAAVRSWFREDDRAPFQEERILVQ